MFVKNMAQCKLRNWITNVTARRFLQTLLDLNVNRRVVQGQAKTVSSLHSSTRAAPFKKNLFYILHFHRRFPKKIHVSNSFKSLKATALCCFAGGASGN